MLINQLLNAKGRHVFTVAPEDTLVSVSQALYTHKVGAFVVADRVGRMVGIISERDIIRAIATNGPECLSCKVQDYMTRDVISASPGESVDAMLDRMTARRIRHLPVMESNRLVGIVSIGDLVKARIEATEYEAHSLKAYIAG